MTGAKYAVFSSSSTFSSSETSSMPSLCGTGACLPGLLPLNTKLNSLLSNFGTSASAGLNAGVVDVVFCEPNEKLNDGVPNEATGALDVEAGVF